MTRRNSSLAALRHWGRVALAGVAAAALVAFGCASQTSDVQTLVAPGLPAADLGRLAIVAVDNTDQQRYRSAITKEGTLAEAEKQFALALAAKGYGPASAGAAAMAAARLDLASTLDNAAVVQLGRATGATAVLLIRITQYSREEASGSSATPPLPGGYGTGNSSLQSAAPAAGFLRKQFRVTAAVTARLISVPTGQVLWTGWDSHSADRLDGDDDGGVLKQTCDDIAQALPARPVSQHAASGPVN